MTGTGTTSTASSKTDVKEEKEEVAKPKVYTDHYVVWDQEAGVIVAGPFAEEDSADEAKTQTLSKSYQWEPEHLTIEKLPH